MYACTSETESLKASLEHLPAELQKIDLGRHVNSVSKLHGQRSYQTLSLREYIFIQPFSPSYVTNPYVLFYLLIDCRALGLCLDVPLMFPVMLQTDAAYCPK
jgi:hypothetical protein